VYECNFEFIEELGKGSFGAVHKVRSMTDDQIFAAKEISYGNMTEQQKKQVVTEVNILKDLDNPFIVRYYDRLNDRKEYR
jgi:NIMA (never in mitosis gene a)-related kinase